MRAARLPVQHCEHPLKAEPATGICHEVRLVEDEHPVAVQDALEVIPHQVAQTLRGHDVDLRIGQIVHQELGVVVGQVGPQLSSNDAKATTKRIPDFSPEAPHRSDVTDAVEAGRQMR